jgi:hypothetical protein
MSLIDEALRRARQEAARQDAVRQDERYRQVPVLPPMASRRGSGSGRSAVIAAVVAVCIVAGIGIGVLLGRRAGEDRPVAPPAEPVEATPTPTIPLAPAIQAIQDTAVEVTPEPAPVSTPKSTPEPAPTPEPRPAELPRQVPIAEAEPVNPPPALDAAPTPTPAPAPEQAAPPREEPPAEVRTYVREVPLPDGGILRLNGIAFSSAQPVALINDRVLGKGESYQGFIITDIQAGLVELRGNGMTVRVSLK